MLGTKDNVLRTLKTESWCVVVVCAVLAALVMDTAALNGDNVCMVKQKYNITKRVKYRAPMSVRTYEWCFSMPPRCSKWNTEMRDLTRLETEERTAEVAVCCPGYKMMDVSCVPICPHGKTGPGCSEECPDNKWGPNCIHECKRCKKGFCSPLTGECECLDGWQGESCDASMPPTTATPSLEELLTVFSTKTTTLTTTPRVKTPRTTLPTPITTVHISSTRAATPSTPVTTIKTTVTQSVTTATTSVPTVTTSTAKTTTVPITSPISSTTQILTTQSEKKNEVITPLITSTAIPKVITETDNTTLLTISTPKALFTPTTEVTSQNIELTPSYRTETIDTPLTTEQIIAIKTVPTVNVQQKPLDIMTTTEKSKTTITPSTIRVTTMKPEQTKKETTIRILPSTVKFKPKEIWIRPAQKGESPNIETKIKTTHEFPKYRSVNNNNKELTPATTTPKTIIVSIIPTSVSYSTFKKIAYTTSYMSTKNNSSFDSDNRTEHEFTKPMVVVTSTPTVKLSTISKKDLLSTAYFTKSTHLPSTSVTPKEPSTRLVTLVTKPSEVTKTISRINRTNSMSTDINKNVSTSSPITSSHSIRTTLKQNDTLTNFTARSFKTSSTAQYSTEKTTKHFVKYVTHKKAIVAPVTKYVITANTPKTVEKEFKKANVSNNNQIKVSTDGPMDDEEFHILTEPEHITAVMGEKGTERSSVDLISVISIAGGVMMAVITVAVVIVMIERCKKPRYDDVRKINDIRMQVMIDNNDVPPPYVRSIFHTPLPDPPNLEKCHYQPISTLDRNLKQFMRPVVVQTISPIMLENFRGILECHYDHLPRRSHDFETVRARSSIAPSMNDCSELRHLRTSITDSAIEALKCEAKLDVIDTTTSEPLYAEIPCWRPPSEHAIEIMNLNGEAITEL